MQFYKNLEDQSYCINCDADKSTYYTICRYKIAKSYFISTMVNVDAYRDSVFSEQTNRAMR